MKLLIFSIVLFLFTAREAGAYLDPGTGSYIVQVLLGIALGFAVGRKNLILKVKHFFFSKKDKNKTSNKDSEEYDQH